MPKDTKSTWATRAAPCLPAQNHHPAADALNITECIVLALPALVALHAPERVQNSRQAISAIDCHWECTETSGIVKTIQVFARDHFFSHFPQRLSHFSLNYICPSGFSR